MATRSQLRAYARKHGISLAAARERLGRARPTALTPRLPHAHVTWAAGQVYVPPYKDPADYRHRPLEWLPSAHAGAQVAPAGGAVIATPGGMSNQGQGVTGVEIYGPHGDSPVWRCATIWGQSYVTARMMFGNNGLNEYVLALGRADGGEVQVYGVYPAEALPERVAQGWLREVAAALPAALAGRLGGPVARAWRVINATGHLGLVSYLNRLGPDAELPVS